MTPQRKLDWIYAYMLRRDNEFENTDIQRKNFFVRRQEDEVQGTAEYRYGAGKCTRHAEAPVLSRSA